MTWSIMFCLATRQHFHGAINKQNCYRRMWRCGAQCLHAALLNYSFFKTSKSKMFQWTATVVDMFNDFFSNQGFMSLKRLMAISGFIRTEPQPTQLENLWLHWLKLYQERHFKVRILQWSSRNSDLTIPIFSLCGIEIASHTLRNLKLQIAV